MRFKAVFIRGIILALADVRAIKMNAQMLTRNIVIGSRHQLFSAFAKEKTCWNKRSQNRFKL